MEMSTIDMRLITKKAKHLIEKEIMDHVHQKNHAVKEGFLTSKNGYYLAELLWTVSV